MDWLLNNLWSSEETAPKYHCYRLPLNLVEQFKATYLNYGFQFWTGKKCNACQERFTLENHLKKQIELIFSENFKVDEHHASEGVELKWYHKSCLVRWNEALKKFILNHEIPL